MVGGQALDGGTNEFPLTSPELLLKSTPTDIIADQNLTATTTEYAYKTGIVEAKQENLVEETLTKRTTNSETYELGNGNFRVKYYPRPQYFLDNSQWKQIEYATTTKDAFLLQTQPSPVEKILRKIVPYVYGACGDAGGYCYDMLSDGGFSTGEVSGAITNAIGVTTGSFDTNDPIRGGCSWYTNNTWTLYRGYLSFDTSSLPDDAIISSSTIFLTLQMNSNGYADGHNYVNIVSANPATPGQVTGNDIDQLGNEKLSNDLSITGLTNETKYGFGLNATGTSLISKTGYSQYGMKEGHDFDAYEGAHSYAFSYAGFYVSETTDTNKDPYLQIDYTLPQATTTPASTTPATYPGMNYYNDASLISQYTEVWSGTSASSTLQAVHLSYYHVPFFIWIIIGSIVLWVFSRIILELIIRLRA